MWKSMIFPRLWCILLRYPLGVSRITPLLEARTATPSRKMTVSAKHPSASYLTRN